MLFSSDLDRKNKNIKIKRRGTRNNAIKWESFTGTVIKEQMYMKVATKLCSLSLVAIENSQKNNKILPKLTVQNGIVNIFEGGSESILDQSAAKKIKPTRLLA